MSGTDLHLFSLVVESARRQLALNELTGPLAVSPVSAVLCPYSALFTGSSNTYTLEVCSLLAYT